jgi:hypothetical protein
VFAPGTILTLIYNKRLQRKEAVMSKEKSLCCYICHSKAVEEEEEKPGMAYCPIHGWMPIQFFEECEGTEDLFSDEQKEEPEEPLS